MKDRTEALLMSTQNNFYGELEKIIQEYSSLTDSLHILFNMLFTCIFISTLNSDQIKSYHMTDI